MKTKIVPSSELDPARGLRAEDYIPDSYRSSDARRRAAAKRAKGYMLEALRWAARKPCIKSNCGSVCLCAPCSARAALAHFDPSWRPK
jgi:hypothetical protein